jgi:hypothetical protein
MVISPTRNRHPLGGRLGRNDVRMKDLSQNVRKILDTTYVFTAIGGQAVMVVCRSLIEQINRACAGYGHKPGFSD